MEGNRTCLTDFIPHLCSTFFAHQMKPNTCVAFNPEKKNYYKKLRKILCNEFWKCSALKRNTESLCEGHSKQEYGPTGFNWSERSKWPEKIEWPWLTAWKMIVKICAIYLTNPWLFPETPKTRGLHRLQIYSKIQIWSHIIDFSTNQIWKRFLSIPYCGWAIDYFYSILEHILYSLPIKLSRPTDVS